MMLLGGLFGAGGAGVTAAGAASSAITIGSVLKGTATVLGLATSIMGGLADADAAKAAEIDAQREQSIETLQGIDRRRSLKAAAAEAVGEADVAHAASGIDLTFGSAVEARKRTFREYDLGVTSDSGTTMTRLSRLSERAANYRSARKRALIGGIATGLAGTINRLEL